MPPLQTARSLRRLICEKATTNRAPNSHALMDNQRSPVLFPSLIYHCRQPANCFENPFCSGVLHFGHMLVSSSTVKVPSVTHTHGYWQSIRHPPLVECYHRRHGLNHALPDHFYDFLTFVCSNFLTRECGVVMGLFVSVCVSVVFVLLLLKALT